MATRPDQSAQQPAPAAAGEGEGTSFDDAFAQAAADEPEEGTPAPAEGAAGEAAKEGETPAEGAPAGGDPAPEGGAEAPAEGGTEGEQPKEGDKPKEGEQAPAGEQPKEGEQPKGEPAKQAPADPQDDPIARLVDMLESRQAPPADQPKPGEQPQEQPLYNATELQELQDYEKNWPDVAKAEQLKRRAEYHDMMKFIFEQVHQVVAPIQDQLRTVGNSLHLGELKSAVPDYSENLEQEVTNWIDTQPSYLQAPMKQVMQTGTSEEVADLIGRYRAATGSAPAKQEAPASAAAPEQKPAETPKQPAKTELSSAAKQAAESLAPVSGERSQVPQGEDPGDFESAFAKYAATMDG